MDPFRFQADVDSARVMRNGSLKRIISLRRRQSTFHHSFIFVLSTTSGLLFLLLQSPSCHALQTLFKIDRATTPERIQEINCLLGEQNDERRQALGASDSDGPVVRFVALDHGNNVDDAKNDAAVVGCVFCQIKRPDSASSVAHFLTPYIHLFNLHVAPTFRRHGLGTALVERVIVECDKGDSKDDCCKGILLSVDTVNAADAVRIYEKLGFSVSGVKYEGETPMFRRNDP